MPKQCPYGPAFAALTISGVLTVMGVALILGGMQTDLSSGSAATQQVFGCLIAGVEVLAGAVSGICWQIVYAVNHLAIIDRPSGYDAQSSIKAAPPESGRI